MSIGTPIRHAPEDLLSMSDGEDYELVDGQLVERDMSMESSWIAGKIHRLLGHFGEDIGLGWAFPEGSGFTCFPTTGTMRRADSAFLTHERLPGGPTDEGYCSVVPNLAVEVVSPNDLAWQVREKVEDWLAARPELLWVVWPASRSIDVYTPSGVTQLGIDDELTAEPVIPTFRWPVRDLFPTTRSPAAKP
jgi:Uma2 family endonuclease